MAGQTAEHDDTESISVPAWTWPAAVFVLIFGIATGWFVGRQFAGFTGIVVGSILGLTTVDGLICALASIAVKQAQLPIKPGEIRTCFLYLWLTFFVLIIWPILLYQGVKHAIGWIPASILLGLWLLVMYYRGEHLAKSVGKVVQALISPKAE